MVAPSSCSKPSIKSNGTIVSCNKCDICKNFLITDNKFRCTVTGKGKLLCDSCNCYPLDKHYLLQLLKTKCIE